MIDLCVVSYNNIEQLPRLLETLHRGIGDDVWNLFIADNGSTDGTSAYLRQVAQQYAFSRIDYNTNVGYSAACNTLASYGEGDVIGLLNADVWLTTDDVEQIQFSFDTMPDCAILGPKQRDEMGHITHAGIFGDNEHPTHRGWKQFDPQDLLYRDVMEAVTVSGSAYFIRRSVWKDLTKCDVYRQCAPETLGAFLPTPHFFEETFCAYHARAHGYKIFYDGRISIGHSWHSSSPVGSQNLKFAQSREIFRSACDAHGIPHD